MFTARNPQRSSDWSDCPTCLHPSKDIRKHSCMYFPPGSLTAGSLILFRSLLNVTSTDKSFLVYINIKSLNKIFLLLSFPFPSVCLFFFLSPFSLAGSILSVSSSVSVCVYMYYLSLNIEKKSLSWQGLCLFFFIFYVFAIRTIPHLVGA